jgi:hypothetical protein
MKAPRQMQGKVHALGAPGDVDAARIADADAAIASSLDEVPVDYGLVS